MLSGAIACSDQSDVCCSSIMLTETAADMFSQSLQKKYLRTADGDPGTDAQREH